MPHSRRAACIIYAHEYAAAPRYTLRATTRQDAYRRNIYLYARAA